MRNTLLQAKQGLIPNAIGMCPDDPRFLKIINSAEERLLQPGLYYGTTIYYSVCVTSGCLTWPRQVAAIESIWLCGQPLTVRGQWFEYLQSGIGLQQDCNGGSCNTPNWNGWNYLCGGGNLLARQNGCTFRDITGTDKKIAVYCDVSELVGSENPKILLQGYDENRNWIRTLVDGEWVDGEYVELIKGTIPVPYQLTVNFFSSITGVQKPQTNGTVRLYQFDTTDSTQVPIATYEYDETNPSYRRSFVPGICARESDDDSCHSLPVGIIAKIAFTPLQKDTDYLPIGNLTALQFMAQCINKELFSVNQSDVAEAMAFEAKAYKELDRELKHFRGSSVVQPVRMPPRSISGGGVLNMI